jgi:LPXTG-site transpeptidase (sortase) family protein
MHQFGPIIKGISMKQYFKSLFNQKETTFILWFVVIFAGTAGLLSAFGLLPSELQETSDGKTLSSEIVDKATGSIVGQDPSQNQDQNSATVQNLTAQGYPSRLVIPSIGVDTPVRIPKSSDIDVLDNELTQGPVYYPGSGTVNSGNLFIFGHSTGYKVVINKAYKVFNDLKTLNTGDLIYIQSEGKVFSYSVKSVSQVNKDQTLVEFDTTSHLLTLSTCNSFGAKTDRYVVVAQFVGQVQNPI